jgi:hypothetical protein
MTTKEEVLLKRKAVAKTRELAVEYQHSLVGCGHCSFSAIMDALRYVDMEIVNERLQNEMFKGLIGLTGGMGNMGIGTCGALAGSGYAISVAADVGSDSLNEDKRNRWYAYFWIKEGLGDPWMEKYKGITCRETQISIFGKAVNMRIPARSKELFDFAGELGCRQVGSCTIANAAAMATETIIEMKLHPRDLTYLKDKFDGPLAKMDRN